MNDVQGGHAHAHPPGPEGHTAWDAIGFSWSAARRALIGLAFAGGAAAVVLAAEHVPLPEQERAATPAPADLPRHVTAESTFAVAQWDVRCGRTVIVGRGDNQTWSGTLPPGLVALTAEPADPTDLHPHALRLVIEQAGARRETTVWGAGTVTATVPP